MINNVIDYLINAYYTKIKLCILQYKTALKVLANCFLSVSFTCRISPLAASTTLALLLDVCQRASECKGGCTCMG